MESIEIRIIAPLFWRLFGAEGGELLQKGAEKHLKKGQNDSLLRAMERIYVSIFDCILEALANLGHELGDLDQDAYRRAAKAFFADPNVSSELMKLVPTLMSAPTSWCCEMHGSA